MKTPIRVKRYDCVLVRHHGPLYIIDSHRDSSGKVWHGINGKDGINRQFTEGEIERKLTHDEFDALTK